MRNPSQIRFPLLLAALGAALTAPAAQIVQRIALTQATEEYQYAVPLDAFDPRLGTLTSVDLVLDVHNSGKATLLNRGDAADDVYFSGATSSGLDIGRPGGDLFAGAGSYAVDTVEGSIGHLGTVTASLDYVGGAMYSHAVDDDGNDYPEDSGVFTGREIEGFVARSAGERIVAYPYAAAFSDVSSGIKHYSVTTDFSGALTATLTYNYAPVPEPSALAALGVGALALVRRRRA